MVGTSGSECSHPVVLKVQADRRNSSQYAQRFAVVRIDGQHPLCGGDPTLLDHPVLHPEKATRSFETEVGDPATDRQTVRPRQGVRMMCSPYLSKCDNRFVMRKSSRTRSLKCISSNWQPADLAETYRARIVPRPMLSI